MARTGNVQDLQEAMTQDNTNPDIIYNYLLHLRNIRSKEFSTIYQWKQIFLTQTQIQQLEASSPYAVHSAKEILHTIIKKAKESN